MSNAIRNASTESEEKSTAIRIRLNGIVRYVRF